MTVPSNRLFLFLCVIPVILFYWAVFGMSVNVPFQDDFDGLLEPVLQLHNQKHSLSEFWTLLFTQDDERRIVVDRLIATGLYKTTGQLNLRWMIIGGALNLLTLLWVFSRWFKATNTSWWLFLPIPWVLFNIQFYEAVFWAMIPFQHLAVFVWAILTLWLLSRGTRNAFIASVIAAVFAVFADVSGNFIILPGLLILVTQQRWKSAVVWTLVIGTVVAYYFSGLEIPEYRPKASDNLSDPIRLISILVALFGIWLDPGPTFPQAVRTAVAIVMGLGSLSFVLYLLFQTATRLVQKRQPLERNTAFIWGSICFIAIVLAVLAMGRAADGMASIFNSRYRHMYVLWMIFIYLLALQSYPGMFKQRNVKVALIAGSILFCFNAYLAYWGGLDRYRKTFLADAYQWRYNRALPSSPIYLSLRERVDEIYEGVYKNNIYRPESYAFANLPTAPVKGKADIDMMVAHGGLDLVVKDVKRSCGKDDGVYVIFRSPEGEVQILPAYNSQRPLHRMLLERAYYYPEAQIDRYATSYFHSNTYDVEIGIIEGKNQYRLLTGKQLRL